MKCDITIKGKILYVFEDGSILWFKSMNFYLDDQLLCTIPSKLSIRLSSKIRILTRLLRLEPRCIERLNNSQFIVCVLHKLWLLDIENASVQELSANRNGWSDPLNLCSDGKKVYWGDYGPNTKMNHVNIYSIDNSLSIKVEYVFPARQIRHIHNIIWDKLNNQFYVLTGDLENSAGIYKANADWTEVCSIKIGSQQYRAVAGFATNRGLLYATDSVETKNNIYLLNNDVLTALCMFPGSCIYSSENKTHYFFSSTVEPPEGRGLLNMFSNKKGEGISDYYSHIVSIRKSDFAIEEVLKLKKDCLPMKLFQYGTAMFPKGQSNHECLHYYIMACKGDGQSKQILMK